MERRSSQIAKQQRTNITKIVLLRKKLQKPPALEEKYINAIKEYIDKGYAIKLSEREANKTSNITNYMPHHCVFCILKSPTKYL